MERVKWLFALTMSLFLLFALLSRLPLEGNWLPGIDWKKSLKVITGFVFVAGVIIIYLRHRKKS
ncbi:hypothetical protein AB9P05_05275 [Roseivirga sp. BDSF3-8]|uniref:hypothetical protein n=1 Tax=Roseivirga sp. BDSF3-8 TaxID=3241598 RepID=UPI003531C6D7